MSQVKRITRALAIGCALLAVIAVGCSKKNGAPFDPDAGHPADFFPTHPVEYRSAPGLCDGCHGSDLRGGISTVSCSSISRDGRSCHPGGPGGHPAGWRALHSADPSKAETCAPCHDNKANNLAPNCFDNSLCHGPKSGHPAGWSARDQHGAAAKAAPGGSTGFPYCRSCHGSNFAGGTTGRSCLSSSCHGWGAPHASSGWSGGDDRHRSTQVGNVSVCAQCHPVSAPSSGTTCSHNGGACHED